MTPAFVSSNLADPTTSSSCMNVQGELLFCRGDHCPPADACGNGKPSGRIWNPPLRRRGRRPRRPGEPAAALALRADMESAPTSPLKLKLHLFRQVCRGRIYASRAVYPLYRMIVTAAAGGIVAVPTSQPILFILVYGRGRGMPRPYQSIKTKSKALELPRCYSLKPPPARGLFVMPFNSLYNFCRLAAKAKKDFFSLGICVMID